MNKEIKKKWIMALESGKYKQVRHFLYIPYRGYCCIGVLREVIDPGVRYTNEESSYLSPEHARAAELSDKESRRLVRMNDGNGESPQSFKQIAAWIRNNL